MNSKKFFMYFAIILIVITVLAVGYYIYDKPKKENKEITEIIPQEELSDEKLRQTIVTLYFLDIDTGALYPEARQIDAKELLQNPYKFLIDLLINGPNNEKLVKLIPEGTRIIDATLEGDTLVINFSEEFIKDQNLGKEQEELIINSIVNTVTELVEVQNILVKIEGEKDLGFPDGGMLFNNKFVRQK